MRYVNAPEPDPKLFEGPIMYTCTVPCADIPNLQKRFSKVELFDHLTAAVTASGCRVMTSTGFPARSARRSIRPSLTGSEGRWRRLGHPIACGGNQGFSISMIG